MLRMLLICTVVCVLDSGETLSAEEDKIAEELTAAISTYDEAIKEFKADATRWLEKEEEEARKSRAGATEQVQQIQKEKAEFDKFWVLPSRAPKKLLDAPAKAADKLIDAYNTASDEYTRDKQDAKALAVQKQLNERRVQGKFFGDFRDGNLTEILRSRFTQNALPLGNSKIILSSQCTLYEAIQKDGKLTLTFILPSGQKTEFVELQGAVVIYKAAGGGAYRFTIKEKSRKETFAKRGLLIVEIKGPGPN